MLAEALTILWWLIVGHALADFSLQTDVMAKGKNRHNRTAPPPNQKFFPCWPYWLTAHALIHGGAVALVTGQALLGVLETVFHWAIDFAKCEGWTDVNQDQALHALCKVAWVVCWFFLEVYAS